MKTKQLIPTIEKILLIVLIAVGSTLITESIYSHSKSTKDYTSAFNTESGYQDTVYLGKGRAILDEFSNAFEAASSKISPSVVPIFAEQVMTVQNPFGSQNDPFKEFFGEDFFKRFFGGENQKETVHSLGSGVIVSQDGYILTNNHVVQGASKLTVSLNDKKKYDAKVIGTDPQTDVAVIKIDANNLPTATLGNSDNVKIGQWVIAVGNPFRLMHTVTAGIISAKGRSSVGLADYEDFMQTDAAINPGNSGGALTDLDGNVIGINTAISTPSGGNVGIGFAIPINMAKKVMDELIKNGSISRGYLALVPQDITDDLAKALNLKDTKGVLVGDVMKDGPADKAGIKTGDVIISVNNKKVENSTQLRNMIAEIKPGSEVNIKILRNNESKDIEVKIGERPNDIAQNKIENNSKENFSSDKLGFTVQNLTSDISKNLGYKGEKGVLVTSVKPGSAADDAGIQVNDLIKEVNRTKVGSVDQFEKEISKLSKGDTIAFLIQRGKTSFYIALEISA
jgi:serine protease Do